MSRTTSRRSLPGAVKELREVIEPLPDATQAEILGANATELYRVPP